MNGERTTRETRAARFAALGDPVRLHLVDLLTLGDRSPSELAQLAGIPSNLVAHHLKVLEQQGVIERLRSEGDRRRSYVRFLPDALDLAVPAASIATDRVVFVCTANSARSQLAEALWRRESAVPTASAGTHPAPRVAAGAIATARRHGLELGPATPRPIREIVRDTDFVVTVCDVAHEELPVRAVHWSIPDPVARGTAAAYDAAYRHIERRVAALAHVVEPAA